MIQLSVVIPVRNDAERLRHCLASLQRSGAGLEIIVADNGSSDDSADAARNAGATVIELPNRNVAQVRNAAVATASGNVIAFVDADHVVAPDWPIQARRCLADDNVGAVGALYLPPEDGTWVQKMYGALRGRTIGRAPARWLGSGNLIVRKAAFDQIGGFDETLEACEDVDLCQRLTAAGWEVIGDERLKSVHHGDPPTLSALFRAERWRGRDNLKVSLRAGVSLRDLPSLLAPILFLIAAASLLLSPIVWIVARQQAVYLTAAAVGLLLAVPVLQSVRMIRRSEHRVLGDFGKALSVAVAYSAGRAAALLAPARHHRR